MTETVSETPANTSEPDEIPARLEVAGGPFTMSGTWLATAEISDGAFRLFHLLMSHVSGRGGSCWPGQQRLAELARCSERTVIRRLHELEDIGAVRSRRRLARSNVYTLHVEPPTSLQSPEVTPVSQVDESVAISDTAVTTTSDSGVTTEVTPLSQQNKNHRIRRGNSSTDESQTALDAPISTETSKQGLEMMRLAASDGPEAAGACSTCHGRGSIIERGRFERTETDCPDCI